MTLISDAIEINMLPIKVKCKYIFWDSFKS